MHDLTLSDVDYLAPDAGLSAPRKLVPMSFGDEPALLAVGRYGMDIEGVWLNPDGRTSGTFALHQEGGGAPDAVEALAVAESGGETFLVTAARLEPGLSVWRVDPLAGTGVINAVAQPTPADLGGAGDIVALRVMDGAGGQAEILALTGGTPELIRLSLSFEGHLTEVARLGAGDGLPIDTPTHLKVVELAGAQYALVGAAGTSSISVVALEDDGRLRPVDQINDTLDTRFQGLSVLETITLEGQVYVVAGGTDDGLSVPTLLPGGRLSHTETIPDDLVMARADPNGLALSAVEGGFDIFVAGDWHSDPARGGRRCYYWH